MTKIDPAEISTDPEVLRERIDAFGRAQDRLIAEAYPTREAAKAACGRGQHVVEIHGLAGFFVR